MTQKFVDNYTRGYIKITVAPEDIHLLPAIADRVMQQASDFEDDKTDTPNSNDYGIVTRADVLEEPGVGQYIIAPFIAYGQRDGDADHITNMVEGAARAVAPTARLSRTIVVLNGYHGNPRGRHKHLGRAEKHQPGNPHSGNSWG
jgi:hypothetical protein